MAAGLSIADVVAKTAQLVVRQSIDIPRILVVPRGEITTGFERLPWIAQIFTIRRLTVTC